MRAHDDKSRDVHEPRLVRATAYLERSFRAFRARWEQEASQKEALNGRAIPVQYSSVRQGASERLLRKTAEHLPYAARHSGSFATLNGFVAKLMVGIHIANRAG